MTKEPCEDWYDVPSNEMNLEQARRAVKELRKKLVEYLYEEPCEIKGYNGETYTLELAMFGQEVLNEMACFRHVSEGTTADHIFEIIQKYSRIKQKFDSMIGTFS